MALLPHNLVWSNRAAPSPQSKHVLQTWPGCLPKNKKKNKNNFHVLFVHFPVYYLGLHNCVYVKLKTERMNKGFPNYAKSSQMVCLILPTRTGKYHMGIIVIFSDKRLTSKLDRVIVFAYFSHIKAPIRKWDILYVWNRTSGVHTISWLWGNGRFLASQVWHVIILFVNCFHTALQGDIETEISPVLLIQHQKTGVWKIREKCLAA